MRAKTAPSTVAFGDWVALYLTGLFLVVFLLAHLWAVHYAAGGEVGFTFDAVRQKLRTPLFAFLDLGLLVLATYHGLVGTRRFVVDLEILGTRAMHLFTWALMVAGLAGLYYGWLIFRSFVG